jgi:hypothetical protein
VLHNNAFPAFDYDRVMGPTGHMGVTVFRIDTQFHLSLDDYNHKTPTPTLRDGTYYWYVVAIKGAGDLSESETWEFRIDTSCQCTDTPTPTETMSR